MSGGQDYDPTMDEYEANKVLEKGIKAYQEVMLLGVSAKAGDGNYTEPYSKHLPDTTEAKKLAESHWKFIKSILNTHDVDDSTIKIVEFYFREAFIHGYRHGIEGKNININISQNQSKMLKKDYPDGGFIKTKDIMYGPVGK